MRTQTNQPRRPGSVLLLVGLLLFVFLALAALVIDLGIARMTQKEMQNAVDSSALEGLRYRDTLPPQADPRDTPEQARRQAASQMASLVFDDDLNPRNGDPLQFGAGPVLDLNGGIDLPGTNFKAAQTLIIPDNHVYKPDLRPNLDNNPTGDMVSGSYAQTTLTGDIDANQNTIQVATGVGFPRPFGGMTELRIRIDDELLLVTGGFNSSTWTVQRGDRESVAAVHLSGTPVGLADPSMEANDYSRNDFSPSSNDAFLVRMRRGNEPIDPGSQESSTGSPIPYLFGRGTLLNPDTKAAGITVRATAIAQARRALSVGAPHLEVAPPLPGATSFVLFRPAWEDAGLFPVDQPIVIVMDGSGAIRVGRTPVGYFFSAIPASSSLGQAATALAGDPAPAQLAASLSNPGYVPIIPHDGSALDNAVLGFGYLEIDSASITSQGFRVTKRTNRVAAENGSASLIQPLPALFSDGPAGSVNLQVLLNASRGLGAPLLAPALAR